VAEEKKEPTEADRLIYGESFTCLAKAAELAQQFLQEQKGTLFAVSVCFVSTNGEIVFNSRWLQNKELLYQFVYNGKPIRHPEFAGMARKIVEYLNHEDGANLMIEELGDGQ
jgi:hypothetical protein